MPVPPPATEKKVPNILSAALIKRVYPTENDIAEDALDGNITSEKNLVAYNYETGLNGILPQLDANKFNTYKAEFQVLQTAGLNYSVSRGRAVIDGYYLELISGAAITVDKFGANLVVGDNTNTLIFLTLLEDITTRNIKATDSFGISTIIFLGNATSPIPKRGIPLALITSAGGIITKIVDIRQSPSCQVFHHQPMLYYQSTFYYTIYNCYFNSFMNNGRFLIVIVYDSPGVAINIKLTLSGEYYEVISTIAHGARAAGVYEETIQGNTFNLKPFRACQSVRLQVQFRLSAVTNQTSNDKILGVYYKNWEY